MSKEEKEKTCKGCTKTHLFKFHFHRSFQSPGFQNGLTIFCHSTATMSLWSSDPVPYSVYRVTRWQGYENSSAILEATVLERAMKVNPKQTCCLSLKMIFSFGRQLAAQNHVFFQSISTLFILEQHIPVEVPTIRTGKDLMDQTWYIYYTCIQQQIPLYG